LPRDIIYAWVSGTKDVEYEGVVYRIEKDTLLVHFCEDFHQMYPVVFFIYFLMDRNKADAFFSQLSPSGESHVHHPLWN